MERRQGRRHAGIPRGLIAGLSERCHKKEVALGVHRAEAKAAGTRVVLGHREVFWGHTAGQACGCIVGVSHDRLCNVEMHLRLRSIGSCDKAVQTRSMKEEANQAKAACPDCDADQMKGNHEAV
jgi:hypothetical protein